MIVRQKIHGQKAVKITDFLSGELARIWEVNTDNYAARVVFLKYAGTYEVIFEHTNGQQEIYFPFVRVCLSGEIEYDNTIQFRSYDV